MIEDTEIRRQLARILESSGFAGSARLRRFLTYVVEQQLAGEGARLKEYAIGVEVFDRKEPYDPRLDSIVRVEAGRLRSKLNEYYATQGTADEIRISLPRGSYVPVFERQGGSSAFAPSASADRLDPPEKAAVLEGASNHLRQGYGGPPMPSAKAEDAPLRTRRVPIFAIAAAAVLVVAAFVGWRSLAGNGSRAEPAPGISIAVLPFDQFSGSEADVRLADQITDEVTTASARLGKLAVGSRTSARQFQGVRKPMHEIGDALGAQVVMEASVEVNGDEVLVQPRLVDATIDRKIWVGAYRGPKNEPRTLAARLAAEATDAVLNRQTDRK